ncbi:unnamed protein product [Urochloa decumbens]|uniref:Cytochrome P450 n=1 Tax=Urochloa decumbens TaxID=240449 RepID=A0ABC8ZZC5_9POAL
MDVASGDATLLLLAVVSLLITAAVWSNRRRKDVNAAPSPPSRPLLGHLHLLGKPLHRSLAALAAAHGSGSSPTPLLFLRLGSRRALLVSGHAAAEEWQGATPSSPASWTTNGGGSGATPAKIDPEFYTDTVIKGIVMILLSAGTDTSALTTEWAMAFLLTHPEAMSKVRAELDTNIGTKRLVEESDITNLPYLQCVVKETLRLCLVGLVIPAHEAMEDCTVGGYQVRRGTMILMNAWLIHRDPKLWEAPEEFRPERFLDTAGVVTAVTAPMLPFGLGQRRCPGEGLAMRLVSLTLAALVQCFEWDVGEGGVVDMDEGVGLTMPMATPLSAVCRPRKFVESMLSAST